MLHYLLAGRLSRRNGEGVDNAARGGEVGDLSREYSILGARQDGELQSASFGGLRRQPAAQREQQDQLATVAGCRVETVTAISNWRRSTLVSIGISAKIS